MLTRWGEPHSLPYVYWHYRSGNGASPGRSPHMRSIYPAGTMPRQIGSLVIIKTAAIDSCYYQSSGPSTRLSVPSILTNLPAGPMLSWSSTTAGSWKPDPAAKVVDAFSVSWAQDKPYLFPPFNLIGRALTKIQTEAVEYACIIEQHKFGILKCWGS